MIKKNRNKIFSAGFILILIISGYSCDQTRNFFSQWQRDVVMKRYGLDIDKTKQIKDWEKEILKYEKVINKKLEAGANEAKIYRKMGEAYAGMQMYLPCADNLQKAMDHGYVTDDILYMHALCLGSLARQHNWDEAYRNPAEAGFLKVLNVNPEFHQARLELALLYFYGFGSISPHSVNSDKITSTREEYREKAISLAQEYQKLLPEKTDGYLVLAGMYNATGKRTEAIRNLQTAIDLFRKYYPKSFEKLEDYQKTVINLRNLQGR